MLARWGGGCCSEEGGAAGTWGGGEGARRIEGVGQRRPARHAVGYCRVRLLPGAGLSHGAAASFGCGGLSWLAFGAACEERGTSGSSRTAWGAGVVHIRRLKPGRSRCRQPRVQRHCSTADVGDGLPPPQPLVPRGAPGSPRGRRCQGEALGAEAAAAARCQPGLPLRRRGRWGGAAAGQHTACNAAPCWLPQRPARRPGKPRSSCLQPPPAGSEWRCRRAGDGPLGRVTAPLSLVSKTLSCRVAGCVLQLRRFVAS